MIENKGFKTLNVWKKADELAYAIYQVTRAFPKHELFSIASQMRRAGVSVPANIAEGYAHYGLKEKKRYYEIANCSLTELEYYIYFVYQRLNYIDSKEYSLLEDLRSEIGKMLHGLRKSAGGKGYNV